MCVSKTYATQYCRKFLYEEVLAESVKLLNGSEKEANYPTKRFFGFYDKNNLQGFALGTEPLVDVSGACAAKQGAESPDFGDLEVCFCLS